VPASPNSPNSGRFLSQWYDGNMRNILAVIAGLISIIATLPYIRDTLKGKTHPNIVTWLTWGLLSGITAVAALSGGANQTAIFAGALALCNIGIVIAGLRYGVKRYTRFDIVCQILAIVGVVLWRVTNDPALAVLFNIISDLIGALPTYRHIWRKPREETLTTFIVATGSSVLVIISLARFDFISFAYPFYILASCLSFALLIVYSRRKFALNASDE
jgi:hypothetical protein